MMLLDTAKHLKTFVSYELFISKGTLRQDIILIYDMTNIVIVLDSFTDFMDGIVNICTRTYFLGVEVSLQLSRDLKSYEIIFWKTVGQ